MNAAQRHDLVLALVILTLTGCFAILWRTRAKGTWFAPLAVVSGSLLGAVFAAFALLEFPTWWAEVVVSKLSELPLVFVVASVCLAMAGGRPMFAYERRTPFGEAARRPRLRTILTAAPALLILTWVVTLGVAMAFPVPIDQSFAKAPPSFLVITALTLAPILFYTTLITWLFAKATGPSTPALRLRLKNLCFSIGAFSYLLVSINVVINAAVRMLLPDGPRETIVAFQIGMQYILIIAAAAGFAMGLALRFGPVVSDTLVCRYYPVLLRLQDQFEARRWQLTKGGRIRHLVRTSYYAREAANLLNLSEAEIEKMIATIELAMILCNPPEEAPEINLQKARTLLALQRRVIDKNQSASRLRWSASTNSSIDDLLSAPLHDSMEAALSLADLTQGEDVFERLKSLPWFQLAGLAVADIGIVAPERMAFERRLGDLANRRTHEAYVLAKTANGA